MNRLGMLVDLSHVSPGDDERRARRDRGAGHLLALVRARAGRPSAQRARLDPRAAAEERRRRDGDVRARRSSRSEVGDWEHGRRRPRKAIARGGAGHGRARTGSATSGRPRIPRPTATLAQVADHIEHVRKVAGVDHVGIGSDFDGIDDVPVGPRGRLEVSGPLRRADPPRLERRGSQEARRTEPAARAAPGRGDRRAAPARARAVHAARSSSSTE